jgi:glutathione S-transferase
MKARLYQFIYSPFCAKVRKILEYKGVEFETVEVDYLERKELLVASGQLMVPALVLASDEAVVDSDRIAARIEELYPDPTLFPPGARGLHIALARYIDTEIEDALFRLAVPDVAAYQRSQGADREAFWRFIRERRYGAGFCDRMVRERDANHDRAAELLAPFEEQLGAGAFLTGRIGLADFALYGQLYFLAFTGKLKIPPAMPKLRAFFGRMDRLSSTPEQAAS